MRVENALTVIEAILSWSTARLVISFVILSF